MHQTVFAAFERICRTLPLDGPVLEIGAVDAADTLLLLPAVAQLGRRIGINLAAQGEVDGIEMLVGNANAMPQVETGSIGLVLCNAVLEHDPKFWLTLAEARRVLRPGGHFVIGVPGYVAAHGTGARLDTLLDRLWPRGWAGKAHVSGNAASTPVLNLHNFPSDYYRFSAAAVREVFLEGFDVLGVETLMHPPRLIGIGRKPG